MTYRAHIKNGVAVIDTPVLLADGTPVEVVVEDARSAFWNGASIEELARQQGVQPLRCTDDLAIDWPEEDSLDEFSALVREVRR